MTDGWQAEQGRLEEERRRREEGAEEVIMAGLVSEPMIALLHLVVTQPDRLRLGTLKYATVQALLRRALLKPALAHRAFTELVPTRRGRAVHLARCKHCALNPLPAEGSDTPEGSRLSPGYG